MLSHRVDAVLHEMNLRAQLLQEEIDRRFTEAQRQLDQLVAAARDRSVATQRESDQRFAAAERAVEIAMSAADRAVAKAEAAAERRFDAVNEFRKTLSDQTQTFATRDEVTIRTDALNTLFSRNVELIRDIELRLTTRLEAADGRDSGKDETKVTRRDEVRNMMQALALAVLAIGVIVSVIVAFTHH